MSLVETTDTKETKEESKIQEPVISPREESNTRALPTCYCTLETIDIPFIKCDGTRNRGCSVYYCSIHCFRSTRRCGGCNAKTSERTFTEYKTRKEIMNSPLCRDMDLPVECKKNGCSWKGSFGGLADHRTKECEQIMCAIGCNQMILLSEINIHEFNRCDFSKVKCEPCKWEGFKKDYVDHHISNEHREAVERDLERKRQEEKEKKEKEEREEKERKEREENERKKKEEKERKEKEEKERIEAERKREEDKKKEAREKKEREDGKKTSKSIKRKAETDEPEREETGNTLIGIFTEIVTEGRVKAKITRKVSDEGLYMLTTEDNTVAVIANGTLRIKGSVSYDSDSNNSNSNNVNSFNFNSGNSGMTIRGMTINGRRYNNVNYLNGGISICDGVVRIGGVDTNKIEELAINQQKRMKTSDKGKTEWCIFTEKHVTDLYLGDRTELYIDSSLLSDNLKIKTNMYSNLTLSKKINGFKSLTLVSGMYSEVDLGESEIREINTKTGMHSETSSFKVTESGEFNVGMHASVNGCASKACSLTKSIAMHGHCNIARSY